MVTRAFTVLLVACSGLLFALPALAGEIEGHVFSDVPDPLGTDGAYDPGIDLPSMEAVLLTQIGTTDGPPSPPGTVLDQWFAFPDADGAFVFSALPDNGIFQVDLPFQSDAAGFLANIVTPPDPMDPMGMVMVTPVPAPPDGIVAMPPTPTVVDIPVLPASAPCAAFAVPDISYVVGGVFVDRNPGGQTGGNGFDTTPGGLCTIGNQGPFGDPADAIEVVLQFLDPAGNPVGTPLTTTVGSTYNFTFGGGPGGPDDYAFPGVFMFLQQALADGESVQVSIDPTQPALAGLLPVADTTVVRTLDLTPPPGVPAFEMIEFRFQPAFDLHGRVTLEDAGGTIHPVAGIPLTLTDLVTGMPIDSTVTDANGDYTFADLFNSVYLVEVQGTGAAVAPFGVRQIENAAPADLDFAFDPTDCPDAIPPVITVPADITVECASTSGNVVTWAASATDNMSPASEIAITYAPFLPGDTIPAGVHVITVEAIDLCGNVATDTFTVTVQDTTPPEIDCTLLRTIIWPPRRGLLPIGLSASASDVCDGPIDVVVTVFSDEDPGSAPFDTDATGTTIPGIRLRAERELPGDGRVYLIRITATDAAGNTAIVCKCANVPRAPVSRFILDVLQQAAAAEAECELLDPDTGVPAGFREILRIGAPQPQ